MNWINIVVILLFASFATIFSWSNPLEVQIAFAGLSSQQLPLFVPIFIAFILGFTSGILALFFSRRKHKSEISRLNHENKIFQQEVNNLRNLPLQDD
ncbi:MAG: LapA family protein [Mariprofundaceae bacterium]